MKKDEKKQKIKLIKGMMNEYGITLKDLKEDDIVGFDAKISLVNGRGQEEAFSNMADKNAESVKTKIQQSKFDGGAISSLLFILWYNREIHYSGWEVEAESENCIKLKGHDPWKNPEYLIIKR